MTIPTHEVIDFGPGPQDVTHGYPFCGTEDECAAWADERNKQAERENRYGVQEIPE